MSMSELIYPRSSWNPRYQDGDLTLSGPAEQVSVHHTVTAQLSPAATRAQEHEQMRKIESVGQSRFGTGISYNVVIFPSGNAYQGASFHRRGTHTGGRNSTTRSICFAGNYEENKPTDAQIAKAHAIYAEGEGEQWDRDAPLFGHRDVSQTACPGRHVYARLPEIKHGAVQVDNPIGQPKPPKPVTPPKPVGLKVDGYWGSAVTRRLQQVLKTPVDGIVSSQSDAWRNQNPGLTTGWDWDQRPQGSRVISELQEVLGVYRDGKIGPNTIRALQKRLGTPVDGRLSEQSKAIMALQRRLNDNRI
jgi:hypothetical protein